MNIIRSLLPKVIQIIPWTKLSPEESVLLELCSNAMTANKTYTKVQKNAGIVNWQRLLSLIRQNRLQVLCKDSFNSQVLQSVAPKTFLQQIISDQIAIQLISTEKKRGVTKAIKLFTEADVRFVVMKTLPYENALFRSPIKIFGDLDILLPISEFYRATQILLHEGYKLYINHQDVDLFSSPTEPTYIPKGEEIFKKGTLTVELHTTLVDTLSFSSQRLSEQSNRNITNELFARRRTLIYGGTRCYAFTPTALCINLFLHCFYQNNYQSVVRYIETAKVLRVFSHTIDWNYIWSFVHKYQFTDNFVWFLLLLEEIIPQSLPQNEQETLQHAKLLWSPLQRVVYLVMKRLLFHPQDFRYTQFQKKLTWVIINKQFFSSIVHGMSLPLRWLLMKRNPIF